MKIFEVINQPEIDFDLSDDLVFYMLNDNHVYKSILFPVEQKFEQYIKAGKTPGPGAFQSVVKKAYSEYLKKYQVKGLNPELSPEELKEVCIKLHHEEVVRIKEESSTEK